MLPLQGVGLSPWPGNKDPGMLHSQPPLHQKKKKKKIKQFFKLPYRCLNYLNPTKASSSFPFDLLILQYLTLNICIFFYSSRFVEFISFPLHKKPEKLYDPNVRNRNFPKTEIFRWSQKILRLRG